MIPLYQPKELQNFLREHHLAPKKSLSQNFLIDGNILRKILLCADIKPGDHVVEIGPGPGVLTQGLLSSGAHVLAIEKDHHFASYLSRFQTDLNHLKILEGDFFSFPLDSFFPKGVKAKVVANLPYHLSTPILTTLLPAYDLFSDVIVMLQKEVATRIVSPPNHKNFGALTVFANFYSEPKLAFSVSPNCFYPKPKVTSAIVHFRLKKAPLENPTPFHDFVRKAFQQRRKTMVSSLKGFCDIEKLKDALKAQHLPLDTRPEQIDTNQFFQLFVTINS